MPIIESAAGRTHYKDFDFQVPWLHQEAPVVLVPGLGCTWRIWLCQLSSLSKSRRVIAIDPRGAGQSVPFDESGWGTEEMAADLLNVVDAAGLDKPIVVGMSMGGTVALQYALDYPERLCQLVLFGAFASAKGSDSEGLRPEALEFVRENSVRTVATTRMTAAIGQHGDKRLRDWLIEMISQNSTHVYRTQAEATFAFDVRNRLHEISVPTVVMNGELDRTATVQMARHLSDHIPGAQLHILEGLGHFGNLAEPERFNAPLSSLLLTMDS
jgi:pimeloyl-ACP methyl ester carboxylesterase